MNDVMDAKAGTRQRRGSILAVAGEGGRHLNSAAGMRDCV